MNHESWVLYRPNDIIPTHRVMTNVESRLFDLSKPEDIEELVIEHNTEVIALITDHQAMETDLANAQNDIQALQQELDDLDHPTTWADVAYRTMSIMAPFLGIALLMLALDAKSIIQLYHPPVAIPATHQS